MKKYSIILMLSMMLFSLGSCENMDFGDINENTNGPTEFDSAALLTAAQIRFTQIGFRDWLVNPHLYVQYQAQPVYQDESRYAERPVPFEQFYTDVLNPLQTIIEVSNNPEITATPAYQANGSPANQIAVAKIMKVMVYKKLTNSYGAVPYFEALNPDNKQPVYTPQEEIYMDFIEILKSARDTIVVEETGTVGDVIYGGDMAKWQKFANSLLLTITMQMSEVAPDLAATEFQAALTNEFGVIETVEDEAWYQPINLGTLSNPWTEFRPADYNMSEFFQNAFQGDMPLEYSNSTFDARLNVFSTDPTAEGLPYGLGPGGYSEVSSSAQISPYITAPLAPFPFMTSAYTYLNRAEAAELGWTTEDPAAMLEMGIIQSYASVTNYFGMGPHTGSGGLEPIDITSEAAAFAASRLADAGSDGLLNVIREEKWASLFPQGFQAWSEWRRTNVPVLEPSPDPLNDGQIQTRYLYPSTENNINSASVQAAVSLLSPAEDSNTAHVWWDVD